MGKSEYTLSRKAKQVKPVIARIYVQDPVLAQKLKVGIKTIKLRREPWLGEGPTSTRVQVVDLDDTEGVQYEPVQVLASGLGFDVGRTDPEANYKFHQVNVWATVCRALEHLESPDIFGRPIRWAFPEGRLTLYPHAEDQENAWYDRDAGAISFGYFSAKAFDNQTVYTCLSHDVVTHELGHAVLDGLKPLYNEIDSPDVAGFHEYFGDALAMISALTMREIVVPIVMHAPKRLTGANPVHQIAQQFGMALGGGTPFLRSANNNMTMSKLAGTFEEHDYSEVMSRAFYLILTKFYAAEFKLQQKHAGNRKPGQLAVASLINVADYTSRLMMRALDYCPPAGLTYAEYARAVIRADEVAYPLDERKFRQTITGVFRRLGIIKSNRDLKPKRVVRNGDLRPYDIERLSSTETDAYRFLDQNRDTLGIPREVNMELLRLYSTRKIGSGGYFPPREIILEFNWYHEVELKGSGYGPWKNSWYPLPCGGTLVFDTNGNVLHYVLTPATRSRILAFKRYLRHMVENDYFGNAEKEIGTRIESRIENGRLSLSRIARARCGGTTNDDQSKSST